mmetsp:Transcript_26588/g.82773  ORF Transcript_26588/g.82773 Transcript_26588/m.82773 type:complete len:417 (-) Transcript_26588:97-1347(-)
MASRRGHDEQPRRTHVEDGLEIPDHLEGVTFDQKKRLARLAKMGLGPVAKPAPAEKTRRPVAASTATAEPGEDALATQQQQQLERRAALMERERRLRLDLQRQEEEDQRQQQEEERKRQERERAARARAGLKSLGPVQPREEVTMPKPTAAYPTPAPLPFLDPAKAVAPTKMEVKLFPSTVERVASSAVEVQDTAPAAAAAAAAAAAPGKRRFREASDDSEEEGGGRKPGGQQASSSAAAAVQRNPPPQKADARLVQEDKRRKKAKKKRKRRDSSLSDDSKYASQDEEVQEDDDRAKAPAEAAKKQARDGGISWNVMHVESVKGKVSTANKGFTDADLERRFGPRESVSAGGLMSEEEVLAIMRKDKKGKSDSDWAMRRAQRELAEWTNIKAQRMARTGEEKERLVVSGRGGGKLG